MNIKTKIKLYKLAHSRVPGASVGVGVGAAITGGFALSLGVGTALPAVIMAGTSMVAAMAIHDVFLREGAQAKISLGKNKVTRENIKSLLTSYFFLLLSGDKEINPLQRLFLPGGNENNAKIYRKFFLKNISLGLDSPGKNTLTEEEISEVEKIYPGLFKEILGEFLDGGILEHMLFKKDYSHYGKIKHNFITEMAKEFYPEYKMSYEKINNFTKEKIKGGVEEEKLKLYLPFIDRSDDELISLVLENSKDGAMELMKNEAQKLRSIEIINENAMGEAEGEEKKKKDGSEVKRGVYRERINILLKKSGDEELTFKFDDLINNYTRVSKSINNQGSDIQNLEKTVWVNNVYKKIYPSISAYVDLIEIGDTNLKSKETIGRAKASINKQFDILNKHLLEIEQTFKEETISDRLKRIKLQEVITAKTLTNRT